MRSGTIAALLGMLWLHATARLPDPFLVQFLPLVALVAVVRRDLRLAALLAAGFLWACLRAHVAVGAILPAEFEGRTLIVTGTVAGVPHAEDHRSRFDLGVEGARLGGTCTRRPGPTRASEFRGRVRLSWYGSGAVARPRAGERWCLAVRLKRPRGLRNPGGFDYARWLYVRDARATGYVRTRPEPRRLDAAGPGLHVLRERIAAGLREMLGGHEAAPLVVGLALGLRGDVSEQQWRVLRRTGTSHLMAISGLHVGLVATFAFLIARAAWARAGLGARMPAQRAGAIAGLAAATAYAALAGFSLPTQRALVMIAIGTWALAGGRRVAPSTALAAAALAVCALDPRSLLAPGFWLSFVAVGAILFATTARTPRPAGTSRIRGTLAGWIRIQCVVALGVAPIALLVFGRQPVLAPLANLVAVPVVGTLVVPLSLGAAALALAFPGAAAPLAWLAASVLEWLWPVLERMAALDPGLSVPGPPATWAIAVALVGLAVLLAPRGVPGRLAGLAWLVPLLAWSPGAPREGELRITVLDVGQGLSVVVRTQRRTLVYDTGPRWGSGRDAGRSVLVPYLRRRGVSRVDAVVVSHPQRDHAGGLASLRAALPVRRLLGDAGADVGGAHACHAGTSWEWDGWSFRILHPQSGASGDSGPNDASCVLLVRGPGGSVLLPGDLEAKGEKALLAAHPGDRLRADVLLAPHHGSDTSSTPALIAAVAPRWVVTSTGYRNRFRFPSPRVLARYRRAGAVVLDTARDGAIVISLAPRVGVRVVRRERAASHRYWHPR